MCLLFIVHQEHPRYPLLVLGNRDEFHARPAEASHWWADAPDILAGRDLQSGGTWFGVHRSGRWAALTNIRNPQAHVAGRPSRGVLVEAYLRGTKSPAEYIRIVQNTRQTYNGFNLVLGQADEVWVYHSADASLRALPPGIHGLSNAQLNTAWPKVTRGCARLRALLHATPPATTEDLLALLADRAPAPDQALPSTGVSLDWERRLSPTFIVSPEYGTRASTLLRVDALGKVEWRERCFAPDGHLLGETQLHFTLGPTSKPG